ncbi:transcriptional regulator [Sphingobium sp. SCG-1]|uniref:Lrp/AsnC family transcriptional regulator n=1 Tax=Sphingobium sp. SCG-1 TaxID=2072936 RepID=UPI000CD6A8E4|nr:Lrp/AsnC family transcriptional regulator [Sphingobium sp. SCG-1]AUW59751.1 transcriptional regulator [Sphingobium sp. SCG-1]
MEMKFDEADIKLLRILQEDATRTAQDLGVEVGLSTNACWRRIKQFEDRGLITRRVALLDPRMLDVGTNVFVTVRTAEHSAEWLAEFAEAVSSLPEVVEFYRMAGEIDYLIKLRVADIQHYDRVYKKLIAKVRLIDVSAAFAMEEIKHTTAMPLPGDEI